MKLATCAFLIGALLFEAPQKNIGLLSALALLLVLVLLAIVGVLVLTKGR